MKGGKNRQPLVVCQPRASRRPVLGYTIVEVMIVLAVSGIMFLVAATFINGKQARTSFAAGVNQMASNIQGIIGQVSDGKYSDIPFTCSQGNPPSFSGTATPDQGTNSPCVFVGKLLYFQQGSNPGYYIFSLGGNRLNSSGTPAVTFTDIQPVPIYGPSIDLTTTTAVPQNLNVKDIKINGATIAYDFGFIQSPGSLDPGDVTGNTYKPGAQTVSLIYTPALLGPGLNEANIITNYLRPQASSYTPAPSGPAISANLCLTDGTRYATIDIGKNNNQVSVNVTMKGSVPC